MFKRLFRHCKPGKAHTDWEMNTSPNDSSCMEPTLVVATQGRIQGAGPGGQDPPPPFWGTPKLHKEGQNVVRMLEKTPRFST